MTLNKLYEKVSLLLYEALEDDEEGKYRKEILRAFAGVNVIRDNLPDLPTDEEIENIENTVNMLVGIDDKYKELYDYFVLYKQELEKLIEEEKEKEKTN